MAKGRRHFRNYLKLKIRVKNPNQTPASFREIMKLTEECSREKVFKEKAKFSNKMETFIICFA